jgi:thiamine-monophosphate kinase
LAGLRRAARKLDCQLAGGDTTNNKEILINVTVLGEVRAGRAVLRSGASPGDLVFVSGRLGEAELGLQRMRRSRTAIRGDSCVKKHLYPQPRLALGQWLAEKRIATAMMDLSDGLSTDLARLCAASRVGACIEADNLPGPKTTVRSHGKSLDALRLALNGGDDYELLFTVSSRAARRIPKRHHEIPLTCIGQITAKQHLILRTRAGDQMLVPHGWDPFR